MAAKNVYGLPIIQSVRLEKNSSVVAKYWNTDKKSYYIFHEKTDPHKLDLGLTYGGQFFQLKYWSFCYEKFFILGSMTSLRFDDLPKL